MIATELHRPDRRYLLAGVVQRAAGSLEYCIALVPLTLVSLGRRDPVPVFVAAERRLLGVRERDAGRTIAGRRVTHAVLGLAFGVIGLVALGMVGLFVARGLLYGVVDDGPYTNAWGGPSLAGAWAAHLGAAFGGLVATMAVTYGVADLHRRATRWLRGASLPGWFGAVSAVICAAVAMFVVAFVRQA